MTNSIDAYIRLKIPLHITKVLTVFTTPNLSLKYILQFIPNIFIFFIQISFENICNLSTIIHGKS